VKPNPLWLLLIGVATQALLVWLPVALIGGHG